MRGNISKSKYIIFVLGAILIVSWALQKNTNEYESPVSLVLLPLEVDIVSGPPIQIDNPVLIEFWATWCAPCHDTIPILNEIYENYQERGLQVIGLTSEDELTVSKSLEQLPIDYTIALDPNHQYFSLFRVTSIPHLVLMDAGGVVLWQGHPLQFPERLLARAFSDTG